MITPFTIPQNDQSIYYLSQLFGQVGNIYPVSSSRLFLASLFSVLNTTALVIGAILVVHVTVMGLLKTAQEGEFLGKQWSSLWVPLRTVMGIASLFPTSGGYSILQVMIMWVIVQGIGAADTLWAKALTYVQVAGSPYAAINIPTAQVNSNLTTIFQGLVCQAEARLTDPLQKNNKANAGPYYYCAANPTDPFCNSVQGITPTGGQYSPATNNGTGTITVSLGPTGAAPGACGSFTYDDPNQAGICSSTDPTEQLQCVGRKAQVIALNNVVSYLNRVAVLMAAADNSYLNFMEGTVGAGSIGPGGSVTLLTQKVTSPPQWIQNYCNATGQPFSSNPMLNRCCINGPACQASIFPSDVNANDAGSTSDAAANLYWLYVVQPTLGDMQNFIATETNNYTNAISSAVSAWILAQPASSLSGWMADAQSQGWISAGVFYYSMAQMTSNNLQAAMPNFSAKQPASSIVSADNTMNAYRNNYTAVGNLLSAVAAANQPAGSMSANLPPQLEQMGDVISSTGSGIINAFMNYLTGAGAGTQVANPLIAMVGFGDYLLSLAVEIFEVFIAVSVILVAIIGIRGFGLGTGEIDAVAESIMTAVIIFLPMVVAILVALFMFGGMLTVYIPMIPYVIFTFGVIGWFIATIEAMVAAPFVALGILSPGGQHEILGRADPAVMILLNIFLRPTLMVLGLCAAMLMAGVVVTMVNAGFLSAMSSIHANPSLIETFLFLAIYVSLITAALNKCFGLIHMLPNRVLTWIGGHPISYGEEEGLQAVKGGFDTGAGKIGSGASAIGGAVSQGTQQKKANLERKLQKKDDEGSVTPTKPTEEKKEDKT